MSSTITLFVPRVRCDDETTGSFRERFGNDEMYLGAVYVGVSADKSFDVRIVRTRSVGDNYDDKETVNWNEALFSFDLGDPALHPFPKAVLASLVLAEHDWGDGRNDFLETVATKFREKLTDAAIDAVTKATLAAAGVDAGGGGGAASAGPQPSDGIIVGALKDWAKDQIKEIIDEAITKAKAWAGDDVFPPVLKTLDIPSATHTWNGLGDTPEEIAEFTGHDGKYQVSMAWWLRSNSVVEPGMILPWTSVSEGASVPGAPVAAVATGDGRVALFLADAGGGIFTTSGSAAAGWAPWTSVSEGASVPGAPVAAVATGDGRVALFLADPGGGIFSSAKFVSD